MWAFLSTLCVLSFVGHNSVVRTSWRARPLAALRAEHVVRAEHIAFHAEECRRSEELFFSYAREPGESTQTQACAQARGPSHSTDEWEAFSFSGLAEHGLDGTPPAPFGPADLARLSRTPIFSAEECAAVIVEAETDPAWRTAQPLASYAANAATFRSVRELPRTALWLDSKLEHVLFPAVASAFPAVAELAPRQLRVSAASVVKYNASAGQTGLGVHRDGPLIAATVPLNGLREYCGGGTYIEALDVCSADGACTAAAAANSCRREAVADGSATAAPQHGHQNGVLRRDAGHLILHPATVRHGGATITRGLRYILVVWLFSAGHVPHGHYATQRGARFLAQALRIPRSAASAYRHELLGAAADGFREALAIGAGELTESAHVGLGQALLELGESTNAAEAERVLRDALWLAPRSAHAATLLAQAAASET